MIDCRWFVEFFRNRLRNDLAMVSPLKLRINKQNNHVLSIVITCLFQGLTMCRWFCLRIGFRWNSGATSFVKVWCSYCHHLVGKAAFPDLQFVFVFVLFFPSKRCWVIALFTQSHQNSEAIILIIHMFQSVSCLFSICWGNELTSLERNPGGYF